MKKAISVFFAIIMIMSFPGVAFARATHSDDCAHEAFEYEKEVVIKVNSEEAFLLYSKNPIYKYTFIITSLSLTRAVCYMCGRSTMGTVTYKEQSSVMAKMCPTNNLGYNDIFVVWDNYTYERCTACGYRSSPWLSQITYTAQCLNGDVHWNGQDWVVKYEYTQSAGYNLHQSLRWWTEGSYL